jgi:hypothetical protein
MVFKWANNYLDELLLNEQNLNEKTFFKNNLTIKGLLATLDN